MKELIIIGLSGLVVWEWINKRLYKKWMEYYRNKSDESFNKYNEVLDRLIKLRKKRK